MLILFILISSTQSNPTPRQRLRIRCFSRNLQDLCVVPNYCTLSFSDINQMCTNYKRRSGTISSPSDYHSSSTTLPPDTITAGYNAFSTNIIPLGTLPVTKSIEDTVEAPVIFKYPHNSTLKIGSNLNLKCEADGGAVVAIVKDIGLYPDLGSRLESVDDSGIGKAVKKFTKLTVEDGGWYMCVAGNSGGISYVDFHLTVLNLCQNIKCKGPRKCVGNYQNGTATCECPNYCRNKKKNKYSVVCGNDCVNYFTLCHLKNAECLLGATIGIFQKGYCPPVHYPRINLPKEYVGTISESVTLTCDVVSSQNFYITWYRMNSTGILSNKSKLIILNPQKGDEGEYICEATMCTSTVGAVTKLVLSEDRPPAVCDSVGGSHIRTFDNLKYNFNGYGDYVLAMDCTMNSWHVYGRFKPCGVNISCLFSMTVYYNRKGLSLYRQFHVLSKDMWQKLQTGTKFSRYHMKISFDGKIVVVELGASGVRIVWDGMMAGKIFIPSEHGATCGICGNHDNNNSNDIAPRTSTTKQDETEYSLQTFVSSWMIGRWGYVQKEINSTEMSISNCPRHNLVLQVCKNTLTRLTIDSKCALDLEYYIKVCVYDACEMNINWSSIDSACYLASVMSIECSLRHQPVLLEESIGCRDRANFNNKINVYT